MSARHPLPWEWEEHELSEGYSCIVYDARGHRVGGYDHLDRETASQIVVAANHYEAMRDWLAELLGYAKDAPAQVRVRAAKALADAEAEGGGNA